MIYRSGNVLVTKTVLHIGSASYPIRNISSIKIKEHSRAPAALGFAMFGIMAWAFGSSANGDDVGRSIAIFCAVISLCCIYFMCFPRYSLLLNTSGKDMSALDSRSHKGLRAIKNAIERTYSE